MGEHPTRNTIYGNVKRINLAFTRLGLPEVIRVLKETGYGLNLVASITSPYDSKPEICDNAPQGTIKTKPTTSISRPGFAPYPELSQALVSIRKHTDVFE